MYFYGFDNKHDHYYERRMNKSRRVEANQCNQEINVSYSSRLSIYNHLLLLNVSDILYLDLRQCQETFQFNKQSSKFFIFLIILNNFFEALLRLYNLKVARTRYLC